MNTIRTIISGGQTGADIAAIDAAISCSVSYGGLLPKGRKCENGIVPLTYSNFSESHSKDYLYRTRQNVINSDGTLIFSKNEPTGGTLRTIDFAIKNKKPHIVIINPNLTILDNDILKIIKFITDNKITILNVAGPKATKCPGMYDYVYSVMTSILNNIAV